MVVITTATAHLDEARAVRIRTFLMQALLISQERGGQTCAIMEPDQVGPEYGMGIAWDGFGTVVDRTLHVFARNQEGLWENVER